MIVFDLPEGSAGADQDRRLVQLLDAALPRDRRFEHYLVTDVRREVERWTYKPGYVFDVFERPTGHVGLAITYSEPDSGTHKPLRLNRIQTWPLEMIYDPAGWVRHTMLEVIQRLEDHEIREWLRLDGQRLVEPHPENL